MVQNPPRASLPRRQLGRFLRTQREENTAMTQRQVAAAMQWSHSRYARLERGKPGKVRDRDLTELGGILEIPGDQIDAMIELARQVVEKTWYSPYSDLIRSNFNIYMSLEVQARTMQIFRPDIIPGLFQTTAYLTALNRIFFADRTEQEHARRIELRMRRQRIITRRRDPLAVTAILHESVLHTRVGNDAVMAAQLRHLADLSTRANIELRILPASAGFPFGTAVGPFATLDFEANDPTVVYAENLTGAMYFDDESDIDLYRRLYATLKKATLDPITTRNLLRQVARRDTSR